MNKLLFIPVKEWRDNIINKIIKAINEIKENIIVYKKGININIDEDNKIDLKENLKNIKEIKTTWETSNYDVTNTLKLSSSGFNLKTISKLNTTRELVNEIKFSNSKVTFNFEDFEVNSIKNIKFNSDTIQFNPNQRFKVNTDTIELNTFKFLLNNDANVEIFTRKLFISNHNNPIDDAFNIQFAKETDEGYNVSVFRQSKDKSFLGYFLTENSSNNPISTIDFGVTVTNSDYENYKGVVISEDRVYVNIEDRTNTLDHNNLLQIRDISNLESYDIFKDGQMTMFRHNDGSDFLQNGIVFGNGYFGILQETSDHLFIGYLEDYFNDDFGLHTGINFYEEEISFNFFNRSNIYISDYAIAINTNSNEYDILFKDNIRMIFNIDEYNNSSIMFKYGDDTYTRFEIDSLKFDVESYLDEYFIYFQDNEIFNFSNQYTNIYCRYYDRSILLNDEGIILKSNIKGNYNSIITIHPENIQVTIKQSQLLIDEDKLGKLDNILNEWTGTQAEYDALTTKNPNVTYFITE